MSNTFLYQYENPSYLQFHNYSEEVGGALLLWGANCGSVQYLRLVSMLLIFVVFSCSRSTTKPFS